MKRTFWAVDSSRVAGVFKKFKSREEAEAYQAANGGTLRLIEPHKLHPAVIVLLCIIAVPVGGLLFIIAAAGFFAEKENLHPPVVPTRHIVTAQSNYYAIEPTAYMTACRNIRSSDWFYQDADCSNDLKSNPVRVRDARTGKLLDARVVARTSDDRAVLAEANAATAQTDTTEPASTEAPTEAPVTDMVGAGEPVVTANGANCFSSGEIADKWVDDITSGDTTSAGQLVDDTNGFTIDTGTHGVVVGSTWKAWHFAIASGEHHGETCWVPKGGELGGIGNMGVLFRETH